MSGNLEELKARFEKLKLDDHSTNRVRDRAQAAFELAQAHEALDLGRGTVKYADETIKNDPTNIAVHLMKAHALERMGKASKARAATNEGLSSCNKVACLENLGYYKAQFGQLLERLPAPKAKSKSAFSGQEGASKGSAALAAAPCPAPPSVVPAAPITIAPVDKSTEVLQPPQPPACPPPAGLWNKSAWNSKDTWEEVGY